MTEQQDMSAAALERKQSGSGAIQLPDPAVCRIDRFVDREVEITRCLTSGSCPHRRSYQGNPICSYPDIAAKLAGTTVT